MWTTFDAIGEITLTTKGKIQIHPLPQLQQFQETVLMLGMAKEDIGWDSWETQGQGILGQYSLLALESTLMLLLIPKMKKSICGCCGR
jgi:hypothetical protein